MKLSAHDDYCTAYFSIDQSKPMKQSMILTSWFALFAMDLRLFSAMPIPPAAPFELALVNLGAPGCGADALKCNSGRSSKAVVSGILDNKSVIRLSLLSPFTCVLSDFFSMSNCSLM